MPKQEYMIVGFHGGMNDNTNPKDISDIEMVEADGVSSHRVGRLVGIGNKDTALTGLATSDNVSADIEPGYGLFPFSSDYKDNETNSPENWLALYDKANNLIKFYYEDKGSSSPSISSGNTLATGGAIKPSFYYVDDMLRMSDASFSQSSKWYGYINSILFWTNKSGDSSNLHSINKWTSGDQKLKTPLQLIGDEINLIDLQTASPNTGTIGNGTTRKLFLGYWTNEGGDWNGNYEFGVSNIYIGEQESGVSTVFDQVNIPDTAQFYNNEVIFQVFIPMKTSATIADDQAHILGDDRIIGLNWYFREQGEEDWIFLMNTDLKEGGKHYWKAYNADSQTTYGYWTGATVTDSGSNVSVPRGVDILLDSSTPNTHIAFHDVVASNGTPSGTDWEGTISGSDNATQAGKSYYNVYLKVKLSNTNVNGFDDRFGFLRVWGGAVSPLYVSEAIDNSGNTQKIRLKTGQGGTPGSTWDELFVPLALPGIGTDREFKVEVLDENFTVIADSGIKNMTIEQSNKVEPEDYNQEDYEDRL